MIRAFRSAATKRLLNSASLRSTEYVRGKEGIGIVNTEPQPEGIYYKYIYSFDNIPEHFGGFTDKTYNTYLDKPLFEGDNWEFEYHGQWWEIGGSKTLNLFYYFLPLIMFIWLEVRENSHSTKRLSTFRNKQNYGHFMKFNFHANPIY